MTATRSGSKSACESFLSEIQSMYTVISYALVPQGNGVWQITVTYKE